MRDNVRCDWVHCAHGYCPAGTERDRCYAGDPTNPNCPGFITDSDWEKKIEERKKEEEE